jgi:anti-sigma regulatory factor (Ser/Thr protein kinase)
MVKRSRGSESFEFPAELACLPRLRSLIRRFLSEQGFLAEERDQVALVAHELAANAVEHGSEEGHPFWPAPFRRSARYESRVVTSRGGVVRLAA